MASIHYDRTKDRYRVFHRQRAIASFSCTRHGGKRKALVAASKWLADHPQPNGRPIGKYVYRHRNGHGHWNGYQVNVRRLGIRETFHGPTALAMAERTAAVIIPFLEIEAQK